MFSLLEIDQQAILSRTILNIYPVLLPEVVRRPIRGEFTDRLKLPFIYTRECHEQKRAEKFVGIYEEMLRVENKEFSRGQKLLEVGFGPGFIGERFWEKDLDVYGVDIKDCKINKSNIPLAIYGDNFPFPESIFDYVSITSVLHHISRPLHEQVFAELYRVLKKPEGNLLIQEDIRGRNHFEHAVIRAVDRLVSGPEANSHRTDGQWKSFFPDNKFMLLAERTLPYGNKLLSLEKRFYLLKPAYPDS